MSTLNFNANEVEPSIGFDAIPAGKYQAVITDSEMKDTNPERANIFNSNSRLSRGITRAANSGRV